MGLIRDKGYVATTTKDIARAAGVNECTLFRKFKSKKEIALSGMEQEKWRGNLTPEVFTNVVWELQPDLEMFMNTYMEKITPDFVNLSIGLRAPQLYEETAPLIMKIPQAFLSSLTGYLEEMEHRGKLPRQDFECLAMTIFSATFGFTFLKASFGENLTKAERRDFCQKKCGNLCRRNTADKINILYLSGEKIQNRQAFQGPLTEQALPDGSAII